MAEPTPASPAPRPANGDPRPDAADERLLLAGRLAWLEAARRVSRTVRHDLANVFTGISFFMSQLDGEPPEGSATAADLDAIDEVLARGVRLLDLLRDLGREAPEAEVVPLDPAAVLAGIASVLTAVAQPCSIALDPLDSVVVRASRRGLEEAVLALVVDARQAAGAAGGEIRLGVGPVDLEAGDALGLPAGGYAAMVLAAPRPLFVRPGGATGPGAAVEAGASGVPADEGEGVPLPGEPGFGPALAAANARAWGGGLRIEPVAGGRVAITLLVPRAVSRRRPLDGLPPAGDAGAGSGGG